MKLLSLGLVLLVTSVSSFASAKDYNADLAKYVLNRLGPRIENGNMEAGLLQLVNKEAKKLLRIDTKSLRCLGYASPKNNAKTVGICLVKSFDRGTGLDFGAIYSINISEDIEHADTSRSWEVKLQQNLYF